LLRDRPPLTAFIPKESRIYVSDYSMQLRKAAIRTPVGPNYELRQVPVGYQYPEALALAATWYLNPPTAGRFGYFGSFDIDILDFYRRPLQLMVEDFASSRNQAMVMDELRRGSVEYVVTMDPPDLWSVLPLIREEAPFFAAPVRLYSVPGSWPRARFETADGHLEPEPVRIQEMRGSVMRLEGSNAQASRLVVSFANERGWRATVDGKSVPIEDTPLAFISVPAPPGTHEFLLTYTPPFIGWGALISFLALMVVITLELKGRSSWVVPVPMRSRKTTEAARERLTP
ncbi:MAG: YfhO family protein, partial [Vicinamibacteria bacterium]